MIRVVDEGSINCVALSSMVLSFVKEMRSPRQVDNIPAHS